MKVLEAVSCATNYSQRIYISYILSSMATRSRKEEKQYTQHRKKEHYHKECIFCRLDTGSELVRETKSYRIIKNLFGYSLWDGQGVTDHLLIVPKKHTDTLSALTRDETIEFMDIVSSYELQGYDYFGRAPLSNRKTVVHQHTHLVKLDRLSKKFLLYTKKPHIRITK